MKNNKEYQRVKRSLMFYTLFGGDVGFTNALWELIFKSDETNKAKIQPGFPVHIQVYKDWYHSTNEREFFKEFLGEVKNEL